MLSYDDGSEAPHTKFRADQLLFRELEIYLAYRGLADLVNSHPRAEAGEWAYAEWYIIPTDLGSIQTIREARLRRHLLRQRIHGPRVAQTRSLLEELDRRARQATREDRHHGPLLRRFAGGTSRTRPPPPPYIHQLTQKQLSVLSNPPPALPGSPGDKRLEALPLTHALVLDPWLEPLPSPGPAPRVEATRGARASRVLIINSEEFTLWRDHFARLQGVVREWRQPGAGAGSRAHEGRSSGTDSRSSRSSRRHRREQSVGGGEDEGEGDDRAPKLITLIRAKHVSFSDFSVIWPIGHLAPSGRVLLRIVGDLALAFFGDALGAALERLPKREMEEERRSSVKSTPPGRRKRRLRGKVGEVVVH